mmetsp:Transcript_2270/g.3182  ORF Transcript_2270/g.3182 Transcript_2270/m.3182 type:complete len:953 (+) Transcript_2270:38-2896(+)
MSYPVLIDSHTGASFTRSELDATVQEWKSLLIQEFPCLSKLVDVDENDNDNLGYYFLVCEPKSAAAVVTCLVTEELKSAFVMSDFDDQRAIAERVLPLAAFVDSKNLDNAPTNVPWIVVDIDDNKILRVEHNPMASKDGGNEPTEMIVPEHVIDRDVKYITFSSGTTGRPKGIFGSHSCVSHMNKTRQELYPYKPVNGRPWAVAVSIFLLWECFRPLEVENATCVVVRQEDLVDPDALYAIVDKYQINEMLFTSSFAKLFLSEVLLSGRQCPPCVSRVYQNGEVVTHKLREAFMDFFPDECELINLYSISECYEVGHGDMRLSNKTLQTFPDVSLALHPDTNEVIVTTPTIRFGYHKPQGDEAKVFLDDFTKYCTGDRGSMIDASSDPQVFELTGRCTNFVRVKGRFMTLEQVADVVERGLELKHGLVTLQVEEMELVAYVDGEFDPELLQEVRAMCPFPEWMPDRIVRNSSKVRLPASSGKAAPPKLIRNDSDDSSTQSSNTAVTVGGVKQVLFEHLGVNVDDLTEPTTLRELGITSLGIIHLKEKLQEAGVEMSVGGLYKISDVRQFATDNTIVEEEVVTPEMLNKDVESILESVKASVTSSEPPLEESSIPNAYFITGATGYLGGWVVNQLAERDPDARVYILARRTPEEARKVLEAKGLQIGGDTHFLQGDLSQESLGLSDDQIKTLQKECRYFIHCGAQVVFGGSYAESRPSNVLGASNVLKLFTGSARNAELHFVSSNAVYPSDFTATTGLKCHESQEHFNMYASKLTEGYGWSKWVAERATAVVCENFGRKFRIYRPGNLGWTKDGRYNPNDFQTLIILACRELNAVPDQSTWRFELTPVDMMADFMLSKCGSCPDPSTNQPTIHNVIGHREPLESYLPASIPRIPMNEWLDKAEAFQAGREQPNDAVEQTRASFSDFATLDMYLSGVTDNSLSYSLAGDYSTAI